MTKPKTYTTAAGRVLTDDDLDAIATEVEHAEYDVEDLKTRRRGRPRLGSAPAESCLSASIRSSRVPSSSSRSRHLTTSEIIRKALVATSTSRSNPSPGAVGSGSDRPSDTYGYPRVRDSTVTVPSGS